MRGHRGSVHRVVGALATAIVVGVGTMVAAGPAQAVVTGTTSSTDLVLYPECQEHDISYTIQESGNYYWDLRIQVEKPNDTQSTGTFLSSTLNSPTSGVVQTYICGSNPAGTWTVKAFGVYEAIPGARVPYSLPDSTFQVRLADTRTQIGVKQIHHQRNRVRLFTTVTDERADGYGRTEGAPVDIQHLVDGDWHKVRGSRERTLHGRTSIVVRRVRGATYRAITTGIGNYAGSTSAPVTLRGRR